ncbi:MAG: hypothetical protein K0R93_3438 [Anaerosolibacter sp.]|jgi:hypothetical protein|uniref:DUF2812 domain-containing protein n=1 Tax=Anaerosolibacter sp. TaxID=1872527 RepID=UPI00261D96DF|nr:DUF2812 domain-containing protein [Anaerosolibacter sp.]MDF2548540.1 hypothetical protein [Anaerosolibacter sp.]
MNRTIHKLRPTDYWRIGEHESWFADMAAEGLHLKKMGLHFVKFVKEEPKKTRYRIDISINREITPEQKQMYAESGWDYVTSYGNFNVFSSPVELNAPELHTDPAEQSYTLKELDKRFAFNAIGVAVAVALMIGMVAFIWMLGSTPVLNLMEGIVIQQTILVMVELYVAYTSLKAAISIRALRKTLSEGKPIDHNAPWKKHHRVTFFIACMFIIFAVLGAILPWVQIAMSVTKTLPLEDTDLPIVRLSEVEQNPDLARKSPYAQDDIDWGNRYSYDWSLLAPVQYESNERGTVPNTMWKGGSGKYSPSISTTVYQLVIPAMGESVVSDFIKKYGRIYRGGDFIETDHADFDLLIVHEEDELKEVFAYKGKAVMYVRYHGYADINRVIESTARRIALISD